MRDSPPIKVILTTRLMRGDKDIFLLESSGGAQETATRSFQVEVISASIPVLHVMSSNCCYLRLRPNASGALFSHL